MPCGLVCEQATQSTSCVGPYFASSAPWAPWEASIAKQRADFTASLSARDRAAFCSGHRLDPGRRDQLLADLAPGVAKNRM